MASFDYKKQLRFVITMDTASFDDQGSNRITLQGFRASVDIDKAGGMMMGTLKAKIYGVSQEDMNTITTLQWSPGYAIKNTVQVFAIDGDVETLVFAGNIVNAWGDYQSMPDVFLYIQAQACFFGQIEAAKPLSIPGGVDVAIVMERIAQGLGLTFENNNVHIKLIDVYVGNSLLQQAYAIARAGNFDMYIDDKVMKITNRYAPVAGDIAVISPQTGLIGYPTFDAIGVNFSSLFNPAVQFGGAFRLDTANTQAAGEWVACSIAYKLESEKPNGAWFMSVRGNFSGLAVAAR